jgi:tetratricopeptide (TPR) repeat protein
MRNIILVLVACTTLAGCGDRNKSAQNASGVSVPGGDSSSAVSVEGGAKAQAQAYLEKGNELYQKDEDKSAAVAYEEAIKLDPDLAQAHLKLGLTYYVIGSRSDAEKEFKAAVEAYQKDLRANPDQPQEQFELAEAYNKLGKSEEAVRALKEAVRMVPDDSDYYFELGTTYVKLTQYQEAASAFQKALEIEPDNFRAQEALQTAKDGQQRKQAVMKQVQEQARKKEEDAKKIKIGGGLPPGLKQ